MLHHIKAAIIDLDGTMLDTAPDFHIAVNRMRTDLGLGPLAMDTIVNFIGKGSENLIRQLLAIDYDASEVEHHLAQALASYLKHYAHINGDHATLYPNVIEGLQALQAKGLRLACVTNKPLALALPLMDKKGLTPYFEVIYGGDSLPHKKPHPLPLLQVCQDFALPPAQVVAIGDSCNDVQAARAAGCRVLNVPYGYNHGAPIHQVDSDGIVSTLLEAAHRLE